jgi:hypothetical protein
VTGHCGRAMPTRKERTGVHSTAIGKEDDGGTPGPIRILSGNRLGRAALRREKRE